jgi:hypothetical protein
MIMTGFRAGILNELSETGGEALDLLGGGNAGGLDANVSCSPRIANVGVEDSAAGFLGLGGGAFFSVGEGVDLVGDTGGSSGEVKLEAGGGKILRGIGEGFALGGLTRGGGGNTPR